RCKRQIVPRQPLRVGFADMTYAEREQEARQGNAAAVIDCGVELLHRHRAETIDVLQLGQRRLPSRPKREDVGGGADAQRRIFMVEEELDLLLSETFDVESVARDEMAYALDRLRRAD